MNWWLLIPFCRSDIRRTHQLWTEIKEKRTDSNMATPFAPMFPLGVTPSPPIRPAHRSLRHKQHVNVQTFSPSQYLLQVRRAEPPQIRTKMNRPTWEYLRTGWASPGRQTESDPEPSESSEHQDTSRFKTIRAHKRKFNRQWNHLMQQVRGVCAVTSSSVSWLTLRQTVSRYISVNLMSL